MGDIQAICLDPGGDIHSMIHLFPSGYSVPSTTVLFVFRSFSSDAELGRTRRSFDRVHETTSDDDTPTIMSLVTGHYSTS